MSSVLFLLLAEHHYVKQGPNKSRIKSSVCYTYRASHYQLSDGWQCRVVLTCKRVESHRTDITTVTLFSVSHWKVMKCLRSPHVAEWLSAIPIGLTCELWPVNNCSRPSLALLSVTLLARLPAVTRSGRHSSMNFVLSLFSCWNNFLSQSLKLSEGGHGGHQIKTLFGLIDPHLLIFISKSRKIQSLSYHRRKLCNTTAAEQRMNLNW